jgi:circadian clock protein KaiB
MKKEGPQAKKQAKTRASSKKTKDDERYYLRLFITGTTSRSARAIVNIRKLCEEYLRGRYDLEVIDITQDPRRAKDEQILAAPTLIKQLPLPLRRFIGDMSETDRLMVGLDIHKVA